MSYDIIYMKQAEYGNSQKQKLGWEEGDHE